MKHATIINKQVRAGLLVGLISMIALIGLPILVAAATQGFSVLNNQAQPGMLMSLTKDSGVVEPASDDNSQSLLGVYVPSNSNNLNQQSGQVQVATDGQASTLVSTINGPVLVGDKISTSPILGVGAKSLGTGYVVGIAQASLDSTTKGTISTTVVGADGKSHNVQIASIPIVVKVMPAATAKSTSAESTAVPKPIQNIADGVAGKHVGLVALIFSFLLSITGITFAGLAIITAVRNGFIAISRQPLAKRVINRQLVQAILVAITVLVTGFLSGYLILRFL